MKNLNSKEARKTFEPRWTPVLYCKKYFCFVYLIFHTLHKAFFSRESYTENLQMDDSAQKITHSGGGKWATPWTLFIYLLFGLCSMTVILPRNGKAVSGNESSMRKEMGQDLGRLQGWLKVLLSWEEPETELLIVCSWKPWWTFCKGLLLGDNSGHCSFHSSWSLKDTAPSAQATKVAEDLKEMLVHLMFMLYCPRSCVRLTAGKWWHTWNKFSVCTLGQYIRRKCAS